MRMSEAKGHENFRDRAGYPVKNARQAVSVSLSLVPIQKNRLDQTLGAK
jgi:hypothetical protein